MASALLAGWERPAYPTFDLPPGRGRRGGGVKPWEAALSASPTAQPSADGAVSLRRMLRPYVTGQTKDSFPDSLHR